MPRSPWARRAAKIKSLPLGVPQVMIWESKEEYVPASQAERYVATATRAGDTARLIPVTGVGRFETASPTSEAWPTVLGAIESLLSESKQ